MSWTSTKTWTSGAVTAAEMNEQVSDNLDWVKDALTTHGITSDVTPGALITDMYGASITGSSVNVASGSDVRLTSSGSADWSSGTSFGPTGITVSRAGLWLAIGQGQFASNGTGWRQVWFDVTGGTTYGKVSLASCGSGAMTGVSTSMVLQLTADQVVTIYARQNSGSTLAVNYVLQLHRLSV